MLLPGGLVGGNGLVNNSPFESGGGWVLVTSSLINGNAIAGANNGTLSAANSAIIPGQLVIGYESLGSIYVASINGTTITFSGNVTAAANSTLFFWTYIAVMLEMKGVKIFHSPVPIIMDIIHELKNIMILLIMLVQDYKICMEHQESPDQMQLQLCLLMNVIMNLNHIQHF